MTGLLIATSLALAVMIVLFLWDLHDDEQHDSAAQETLDSLADLAEQWQEADARRQRREGEYGHLSQIDARAWREAAKARASMIRAASVRRSEG